jgi:hypothetical protein
MYISSSSGAEATTDGNGRPGQRTGRVLHAQRPTTGSSQAADAGLRQLSARLSAGDGFLVAARALGLGLPRQVACLVPARRQLAHVHRAVLRVHAAATTRVPGYDVRKRIVRAAVVHRHGVWIMPLPCATTPPRAGTRCVGRPRGGPGQRAGPAAEGRHHQAGPRAHDRQRQERGGHAPCCSTSWLTFETRTQTKLRSWLLKTWPEWPLIAAGTAPVMLRRAGQAEGAAAFGRRPRGPVGKPGDSP